ncbi:hypothetical protein Noc_2264 [Nitrosococcus oceani ATCC 19707]|uniref:Uncharacterized protein n=2 Tax=Nitrosococcus oceani TaxID=1229 RepID=Q3J8X4_NITOC|nr:hypothetical protein [Nitrosococcus oceani]ABA58722.1 hypothetical protein Noc_2264 [Nitrosococcus oceani ATCC 19707]EDZ67881.1 hypothetical protein NOC27_1208 [Nitrosococcus oceani AFC27]KFI18801.1 hypothetical protein IB75_12110 [Nitrosococcus oceani C-27]GEM19186.1 hypothetical protein NONS58_05610 [Nitrosococcus oceani]
MVDSKFNKKGGKPQRTELNLHSGIKSSLAATDSSCPFLLSTSPLLDYENPLVETRESKVRQWTRKLPVMNLFQSTQALLDVLTLFNEQPLQEKHRVQLLDIYRVPINTMLLSFDPLHLRQLPIPPAQREQVAQNIARLPLMLADGYKTVIKQGYARGREPKQDSILLLAATRACEQLGHTMLHRYRLSHPIPPRLYLELHQLYRYAEHYQVLDCIPHATKPVGTEKNIAMTHKELMLLAIVEPSRLASDEIMPSYELLGKLLTHVRIAPPQASSGKMNSFVIDLSKDHPPKPFAFLEISLENENLRLFDTSSLLKRLGELLHQPESPSITPIPLRNTQLLRRLTPYLNASYQRPSPGKP